ncbi:MAG: ATP-binding protein [bacterium]
MLKRIYIDNYKGFVDFTYEPAKLELLLGDNGSGKTTLFEVLGLLRDMIIEGKDVVQAFPKSSRTQWLKIDIQTIEIDVEGNGGFYRYSLRVNNSDSEKSVKLDEHLEFFEGIYRIDPDRSSVLRLLFNDERRGDMHIFESEGKRSHTMPFLLTRSNLHFAEQIDGYPRVKRFTEWLRNSYFAHVRPAAILDYSDDEVTYPTVNMANFVSWYRHLVLENPNLIVDATDKIRQVIDGFKGISLEQAGDRRVLKVVTDNSCKFNLSEMSDGQRILIVLYTLLSVMQDKPGLLCIDEPDNYVALREIQPWLQEIEMLTEDGQAQVLIISHHPEIINYLAPNEAVRFYRAEMGPIQVSRFKVSESNEGLLPAEIIARGWEND